MHGSSGGSNCKDKRKDLIVSPATPEEIRKACEGNPVPRLKAWAAREDEKVIAFWGFAYGGGFWYCFCDLKPEAMKYKMTMMKHGKRLIEEAKKQGIKTLYANADLDYRGSVLWLLSLGFERVRGTLFKWQQ